MNLASVCCIAIVFMLILGNIILLYYGHNVHKKRYNVCVDDPHTLYEHCFILFYFKPSRHIPLFSHL